MAAVDPKALDGDAALATAQLSNLFGSYKAEWLQGRIYELYSEPSYLPELITPRPCMLVGGRGTGKTTVLRRLSYHGQFAMQKEVDSKVADWSYVGIYFRINTNRVSAFSGNELDGVSWQRYFAHYLNLELVGLTVQFLKWHASKCPDLQPISSRTCRDTAIALNLDDCQSLNELHAHVREAKLRFEAALNSIADANFTGLSLQGSPVDVLFAGIKELEHFRDTLFFFLIDEYENLFDDQQRVFNTLIKHCGEFYTFKIAVKELGHRVKDTLNPDQHLVSPADYVLVSIADRLEGRFSDFAAAVCNERVKHLELNGSFPLSDIRHVLPGMTEDEEAQRLGVESRVAEVRAVLVSSSVDTDLLRLFDEMPVLKAYFFGKWASAQGVELDQCLADYLKDSSSWDVRYDNYKHSILFTLKRGRGGIRKYYSGWDVFLQLSAKNIRYLLELVEQSILLELRSGTPLGQPLSHETQTKAAQAVGRKNLGELDGLSANGAKLTRLVLALGRVFQVMAAQPMGHTPEANQFALKSGPVHPGEREPIERTDKLLRDAVTHLALIRSPGNKPETSADTREFDYMLHPIFAPFFEFSYRRKRKITLTSGDVLGLVETPRSAITQLLSRQNRSEDESLPAQLRLFGDFYATT